MSRFLISSIFISFPLLTISSKPHDLSNSLPNSCLGQSDGNQWVLLSDDITSTPLEVTCNNEWLIIDISKSSLFESYFTSFEKWHHSLGGPSNSDAVNWDEWFLPQINNKEFILSPDCSICNEKSTLQHYNKHTTYWMTGNLAKLHWSVIGFNECDMDYNTYQCYDCSSCLSINTGECSPTPLDEKTTDFSNAGICGVTIQSSDHTVYRTREMAQQTSKVRNYKPSIGMGGEYCMCYKPEKEEYYQLNMEQIEVMKNKYNKDEKVADKTDKANKEVNEGNNEDKVVYLSQKDFEDGTYRIKESGTYIITEDIIFDFNKNDDYWPRADQADEYPGSGQLRDAYHLGFFAGIAVETDNVVIDLNGKELKMSTEFYYQQRWFAIIELGNQQFLPGQGPAFFGADPVLISDIIIKNGVLGLSSHFGIHGNFPTNLEVLDVHIKDFVTHGMQLNGWTGLKMNNIEIGPSSTIEYLRGDYGHARIILQRLRNIETEMIAKDIINDSKHHIKYSNHNYEPMTVSDIADELEIQMNLAFEYALNKVSGKYQSTDYINPSNLDTEDDKIRWQQAKDQFIQESGLPSASSITGLFLNFFGASVFSYTMYTQHQSTNGELSNIYVHDLHHEMVESVRMAISGAHGQVYPTPWNSDIPAERIFGNMDRLIEFASSLETHGHNNNNIKTWQKEIAPQFKYIGSVMTDAYFAMGEIIDGSIDNDWGNLGFLQIREKNTQRTDLIDWINGKTDPGSDWTFGCNQDIMGHSGKGLLGIRIDGVSGLKMNNIKIENLHEHSPLGTPVCGQYTAFNPVDSGGHFKQNLPMQWGFSGNNLQGMSVIATDNMEIGDIEITGLYNNYAEAFGLSFWTANRIDFNKKSLVKVSNIQSGIKLDKNNKNGGDDIKLNSHSKPNRSPESCGVRLETRNTALYNSKINLKDNGINNILTCNIEGHETCVGTSSNTMYGKYFDNQNICDDINNYDELQNYLLENNIDQESSYNKLILTHHKDPWKKLTIYLLVACIAGSVTILLIYFVSKMNIFNIKNNSNVEMMNWTPVDQPQIIMSTGRSNKHSYGSV